MISSLSRRWLRRCFLGAFLFGSSLYGADFFDCCNESSICKPVDADWDFGAGYREGEFRWSIAGPGGVPDTLSELKWMRLRTVNYQLRADILFWKSLAVKLDGAWGRIHSGYNSDTDYAGNHKTFPFLRSENNAGRGNIWDTYAGIGVPFFYRGHRFTPYAGAFASGQNLRMFQGHLTIPVKLHIAHLNSRYWARFSGYWAGADLSLEIMKDWQLFGSFQLQKYSYKGTGHWNLRPEFIRDFQDRANGTGGRFSLGSTVNLSRFYIGCILYYQQYRTSSGKQYTYFTDLGYNNPVVSRFNKATWHSSWINLIIGCHF